MIKIHDTTSSLLGASCAPLHSAALNCITAVAEIKIFWRNYTVGWLRAIPATLMLNLYNKTIPLF
jgi:hypothetical protein